MEIIQLKGFCAVVEEESFTKAANRLYLTQPAVSMQIKALEKEFGVELIDRRKTAPTRAGKIFYSRARSIISDCDEVTKEVQTHANTISGTLIIGSGDTFSTHVLSRALSVFSKKYPLVDYRLLNGNSHETERHMNDRLIDIGLCAEAKEGSSFESRPVFSYREIAYVAAAHPLGERKRLSLHDLKDCTLIMLDERSRSRKMFDYDLLRAGVTPENIMNLGSVESVKAFAKRGMGVGIVPDYAVQKNVVGCLDIIDVNDRMMCLLCPRGDRVSATIIAFISFIETYLSWKQENA